MLGGRSAVLTCSVDSLAAEAITSPFLRREIFVMGGYPPVAEHTSVAFSFVPFNVRVNEGWSATGNMLMSESTGCNDFTTSVIIMYRLIIILKLKICLSKNIVICSNCTGNKGVAPR